MCYFYISLYTMCEDNLQERTCGHIPQIQTTGTLMCFWQIQVNKKCRNFFYHKSISANHLPVWGHMFDRLHWNIKATFLMDFHFGNFCWTDIFVDQSSTKLIRNSQWPREFICVNYYFIILLFSFAVIQINSWKKN